MPHTLLAVSAPPFWHCGRTIAGSVRWKLLALLPAAALAVYHWGVPALRVMALAVATAIAAEALASKVMKRPAYVDNLHSALIGLLFAFLLPASAPWWLVAFGAAVCVLIGKMAFGGMGASPLAPALVGWAALYLSWPLLMDPNAASLHSLYIDPLVRLKYFGVAAANDIPLLDLLLGRQIGALGASQVGLLALGGLFLCVKGAIRWEIPASFLAGVAITAGVFHALHPELYASPLFHLCTGSVMLGAFFLATAPSSSPNRQLPMALFGLIGGALVILIRNFGIYTDGVPFAILLINLLMPQLELIRPRPFGARA